jgi:TrmH family RNA methyltransferase
MVSKNQIKFISSLHLKKNRIASQLFIAEGVKVIQELFQQSISVKKPTSNKRKKKSSSIG